MSMSMSIPKPELLRFTLLNTIHNAMVDTHATEESFQDFKYWIQFYASKLNPMKLKGEYSVEAWAKFLDKILSVQPKLTLYENYWPVEVYFDFYMANRRKNHLCRSKRKNYKGRSPNSTMAYEISYDDEFENVGASSSKLSLKRVRDTQQSVSHSLSRGIPSISPGKSSNGRSVDPFGSRLGNITSNRSMTLSARSQTPGWRSTNATASSSSNPVHRRPTSKNSHVAVGFDVSPRMSVQDHSKTEEILVVSCFKCGNTATIESIFNKRLVNLVEKIDLSLSILAKLGIFLDQHLDDLRRLKHNDLMRFFSDVPSNRITPLVKLQFIKSLQAESCSIQKPRTPRLAFISCPPLDTERHLSDPYHLDKGLFQKTMKLEDNDFQELMNTMGAMSRDYFSIYHPNTDQLCEVVTAVCVESRLLNRYERLWPLRIYLKRRSTSVGTRPLYNEIEAEAVFSKVFNQRHFGLPTLIQLPCELHPVINISQVPFTLKTRLHDLGLAGLIPALAYVGVHSDAHFADFCKLNDQERDDLFILGKLKLTQFQRFTLRLALSPGNLSPPKY